MWYGGLWRLSWETWLGLGLAWSVLGVYSSGLVAISSHIGHLLAYMYKCVCTHSPAMKEDITQPGHLQVTLPGTITGDATGSDPKLRTLHDQLTELTRKLNNGDYDIPPEGQRSPSPEPVYDKNGVRQNTREIR